MGNHMINYRKITNDEIKILENQRCRCEDWENIKVVDDFDPKRIINTEFSGQIKLGSFKKKITFYGGVNKNSGIYNAKLHNCIIHDDVFIDKTANYIANYIIEDNVIINNIGILAVNDLCSFGNGVEIEILNEAGGREIPIYDKLTAQIAYFLTFYRHRPKLIKKITEMIKEYTISVSSKYGKIGESSVILNCRTLRDIKVGPFTIIQDSEILDNGSINSTELAPIYIGAGVYAKNFIVSSGSTISDGAVITDCFVGQGCELNKQFSAENSAFFANCAGFHGEACAIFAGPYTVTHHKSTLLIAGYYSFFNAGSGSNQSNHMYKLGPCHQGIVERGSKTASDSYMLWPVRVGAFSLVMGRHYRNSDTSNLPFSYLIENDGESICIPGVNLRSVGTIRDARKWPQRDKRKDPQKLDIINYNLLSPYTVQKMIRGKEILNELLKYSGATSEYFTYNNVKIKNNSLKSGIKYYNIGITKYLGNSIINRFKNVQLKTTADFTNIIKPKIDGGTKEWVDISGMFAPKEIIEQLCDKIESNSLNNLSSIIEELTIIHNNYNEYYWNWVINKYCELINKTVDEINTEDLVVMITNWSDCVENLDNLYIQDAKKEFSPQSYTGFGIDGNEDTIIDDFSAVRGSHSDNSFVKNVREHIEIKTKLGNDLIDRLKKISDN